MVNIDEIGNVDSWFKTWPSDGCVESALCLCLIESKLVTPAAAQGDGVPPAEGGGAAAAGGGSAAGERPTAEGPSGRRGEPGEEDPAKAAAGGSRGPPGGELHPPGGLGAKELRGISCSPFSILLLWKNLTEGFNFHTSAFQLMYTVFVVVVFFKSILGPVCN